MVSRLLVVLAVGCAPEPAGPAPGAGMGPEAIPALAPTQALTRISLDLRGIRPRPSELAALEADPAALPAVVDTLLEDPLFEARMVDFWHEVYLTRADRFTLSAADFGLEGEAAFARDVGEEPLRLVARVAATDRPWTDIVTADWTMATPLLADAWPLQHDAEGWAEARYTDGRPAAGVLATNGLWWRYRSTDSNANRKRANQISRMLLCNDYLVRPISFDREVDLLDTEAVNDAIQTNPACVNCHVSLDPIASALFGFWSFNEASWLDASTYHPAREQLWRDTTQVAPAWYGQPVASLEQMAHAIAGDPRFPQCAVQQVYSALLQRDLGLDDEAALVAHREAFVAGGLRLKALLRAVVLDPAYLAADAASVDGTRGAPVRMLTPDQLGASVEDITGFRWSSSDYAMLQNDLVGVRTLAGGADGATVVRTARSPSATLLLVQERLAEAAATHVATAEAALAPAERRIFTEVDGAESPEDAAGRARMAAQVQSLHRRLFGSTVAADGPEVAAALDLWAAVYAVEASPLAAWAAVLTALLRDPDFLFY